VVKLYLVVNILVIRYVMQEIAPLVCSLHLNSVFVEGKNLKDPVQSLVILVIRFVVNPTVAVNIVVKRYVIRVIVVYALDNFPDFVIVERKSLLDHVRKK
jgi:hypothetical protein